MLGIILLGKTVFWGLFLLRVVVGSVVVAAVSGRGSQQYTIEEEEINKLKITVKRGNDIRSRVRDSLDYLSYGTMAFFFTTFVSIFGSTYLQELGKLGSYILAGGFFVAVCIGVVSVISVVVNMFNGFITKRVIKKAEIALESLNK